MVLPRVRLPSLRNKVHSGESRCELGKPGVARLPDHVPLGPAKGKRAKQSRDEAARLCRHKLSSGINFAEAATPNILHTTILTSLGLCDLICIIGAT